MADLVALMALLPLLFFITAFLIIPAIEKMFGKYKKR